MTQCVLEKTEIIPMWLDQDLFPALTYTGNVAPYCQRPIDLQLRDSQADLSNQMFILQVSISRKGIPVLLDSQEWGPLDRYVKISLLRLTV